MTRDGCEMKHNYAIRKTAHATRSRVRALNYFITGRGQAAVEFALVATVAMIVLFVAVQLALIGEDALALGQMNYQGARWAAVNTCATDRQIVDYMLYSGSPSVTSSGGTCGTPLTFTIKDSLNLTPPATRTGTIAAGSSSACPPAATSPPTPAGCGPGVNARPFGSAVQIVVSFNASHAIFLGNGTTPWMGLINFPTTLSSTETAMAE